MEEIWSFTRPASASAEAKTFSAVSPGAIPLGMTEDARIFTPSKITALVVVEPISIPAEIIFLPRYL
jgi:hypothetical protein